MLDSSASPAAPCSGRLYLAPRPRRWRACQTAVAPHAELALDGRTEDHHRCLLMLQLWRLERTNQDITTLDRHINEKPEPYRTQDPRLMHIPSVDWVVAAVLIADVGPT